MKRKRTIHDWIWTGLFVAVAAGGGVADRQQRPVAAIWPAAK
jgi:hypothetical protein